MIAPQANPRAETTEAGKPPLASVITVNTNEKHRLLVYLPSLLACQGNFEIIISDNGSRDGSVEFINADYPAIRVICNHANVGFTVANNRGARAARGEILVFVNPDTKVEPDWLRHLLEPFADSSVGLVTSKILLMGKPDQINTCGNIVHLTGLTLCRGLGAPRDAFSRSEEVGAISGAAFAIRSELFKTLDGFDEDFFIYMEETDLSWRAQLAGWRCVYAPESIIYHDYVLRFGPQKVLYQERNRYLMLLKNLRWPTLLVLLPALALAEVVTWGFVLWGDRANWKNKFRAYYWIITHWSPVMQKRRATQALRKVGDRDLLRHTDFRLDFGQVGQGRLPRLAQMVFDPLFFLLRGLALLVVGW